MPDAKDPDRQTDERHDPVKIGDGISRCSPQEDIASGGKPDDEPRGEPKNRLNFKVAAELFLGLVIALATVINVYVAYRQWSAMVQNNGIASGQLEVMQNEKRPWIKVSVSIVKPLLFSDWNGNKGLSVNLQFDLKNAGDAPAVNVRIAPQIEVHPGNPNRRELDIPQNAICARARMQADENAIGGVAIFPGDSFQAEQGVGIFNLYETGEPTLFSILGCIDYTYAETRHSQTGFRMLLGHVVKNQIVGLPFIEGPPEPYPEPISPELLANGYPAKPPNIGPLQPSEFVFRPEDSGNYAK
jgi:hypothetical protein